jgi:hypothetical protein
MNNFKIVTDDDRTYECKFADDSLRWDIFHTDGNDTQRIASNLMYVDIADKVWWHDMDYRRVEHQRKQYERARREAAGLEHADNETIRRNLTRDYERVRREETR